MTLSARQILDLALNAGFAGQDAITATAIALAESDGNTIALNSVSPDYSLGLWQINMIASLRAFRLAHFGLPSVEALYDPATNARVAYQLYAERGKRFLDWTTFTGGAYQRKMPAAQTAWAMRAAEQSSPPVVPPDPPPGPALPVEPGPISQPELSTTAPASGSASARSRNGLWYWAASSLLRLLFRR